MVPRNNFYQTQGGGLSPDAITYVDRPIDQELYAALTSNELHHRVCWILAPRQMGKTSLINRTIFRLTQAETAISMSINLQGFGEVKSEADLWFNLVRIICQKLGILPLIKNLDIFWSQHHNVQPSRRFLEFLREQVLPGLGSKLVVFIDEVQNLVAWNLHNEVMGVFRSLIDSPEPKFQGLAFVLVGVVKPGDLLQGSQTTAWNVGTSMTLTGLTGDCEPLLDGLREFPEPQAIMAHILNWTGGQPFLTQRICQQVREVGEMGNLEPQQLVEQVVQEKVISRWRQQDQLNHFQEIDYWFNKTRGENTERLDRIKLGAVRLYRRLLEKYPVEFSGTDPQWELLTSGLVINAEGKLRVTNRIYQSIFDLTWVERKQQNFESQGVKMTDLNKVVDRDVFMLIDQSGSMLRKDEGQTSSRWQRLQEQCMADVNRILQYQEGKQKICDQIVMMPYNVNRYRGNSYGISNPSQIDTFFDENQPMGNANVTPTLRQCFENWMGKREWITAQDVENGNAQGAIFVIYIDGQFDDSPAFESLVQEMCKKIDDQRIFKIIILGFGQDVNARYFDELDINQRKGNPIFKDRNDNPATVLVFELVEEMEPDEGVIEVMQRQLINPDTTRGNFGKY